MFNWQTDSDYGYTNHLTKEGWAWEFLRRNPSYQHDYDQVRKVYAEGELLYGPFKENEKKWRGFKKAIIDDPFTEHGDSPGVWNGRVWDMNIPPEWTYLEVFRAGKWGLKHEMANPESNKSPEFRYPYNHPKYITENEQIDYTTPTPSPSKQSSIKSQHIALGFDLSLPLEKQLDKAKSILITQQKSRNITPTKNQAHPGVWRKYLRVLDAVSCMPNEQAYERNVQIEQYINLTDNDDLSLEDKVENVPKLIKRAEDMMNGGYLRIIRSSYSPNKL